MLSLLVRGVVLLAAAACFVSAYLGLTLQAEQQRLKQLELTRPIQAEIGPVAPGHGDTSYVVAVESGCLSDVQRRWE